MLCAIPLLRTLRSYFPAASITLVTSPVNHEIMLHNPYVDVVLNYDKQRFIPGFHRLLGFYKDLKARNYDIAVVPATVSISTTSNMIAFLSGAPVRLGPRRLEGRENSTGFCFTETIALDWAETPRRHQTLRNLDLLRVWDIATEDLSCPIGFSSDEVHRASSALERLRAEHPLVVGLHPGAGKIANRWSAVNFAAVANTLSGTRKAGIVLTVGPMDDEPFREIEKHLRCDVFLVRGRPIREVAAIINQMDLFITNDTGLMHVAGGTSVPTLSLFGPTDPLQWAPVGEKNRFISTKGGSINSITVDEVLHVIDVILQKQGHN